MMNTIDVVNRRYHRNKLFLAALGTKKEFNIKRDKLSQNYTTDIDDVIIVK